MPLPAASAITGIFVNNGIYGMTGGQMAPTTLLGQKTTSTPLGRDARLAGFPIPITEMLALVPGVSYVARGTIADAGSIGRLKAMIKRACEVQLEDTGFALVEVLSNCPVGWGMDAPTSIAHLAEVAETYPVGVILDRGEGRRRPAGAGGGMTMERSTIFAGFGGQGLLFAGTVLAHAAMTEGRRCSGSRPTGRRCAAARRSARSSSATSRSARRSSTAPTPPSCSTRRRSPASRAPSPRAACSSSTRRSSRRRCRGPISRSSPSRAPTSPRRPATTGSSRWWRWVRSSHGGRWWSRSRCARR